MNRTTFDSKAEKFGDFYVYYPKLQGTGTTYMVVTVDFDNTYIQRKLKQYRPVELKDTEVLVFSWTNDKFRILDLNSVKNMSGLGAVLRNGR